METLSLFEKIISQSKDINNLPTLSEIFEELENQAKINNYYYDEETDKMFDNWNESKITLLDGSQIELIAYKTCILHSFHDIEREYSYRIGDNLYLCASCLTILVEHKDLCEKYYTYSSENLLFPKKWDKNRVILWIRNSEKRQEEYFSRRNNYLNYQYDYFNDEDDNYDDEDYFNNEEYILFQEEVNKIKEERNNIWKQEECQILYKKLIDYAGGSLHLKKSQLQQAKDMAISAIQKIKLQTLKN